jgi:hypothetical protein
MKDDALARSMKATTANLDALTAKLNRSEGAGQAVNEKVRTIVSTR